MRTRVQFRVKHNWVFLYYPNNKVEYFTNYNNEWRVEVNEWGRWLVFGSELLGYL